MKRPQIQLNHSSTAKDGKDNAKRKKKNKKSVKNQVNGPPSEVEDFSKNWKTFLSNQNNMKQANDQNSKSKRLCIDKNPKKQSKSKKEIIKNGKVMVDGNPRRKKRKKFCKDKEEIQEKENDIWFDDVDPKLLHQSCNKNSINKADRTENSPCEKQESKNITANVTRYVAMDCEMVGVGKDGSESVLARVSIVNSLGECVYDQFVKTKEKVVDYRTEVSGVRPSDLKNALDYEVVQKEVSDLLKGRILVGHALHNDLRVLMLSLSKKNIRDTSKYKPFHKLMKTKRPALKKLAAAILDEEIQCGEHNSVIDARVTMQLFKKYKKEWEKSLRTKVETGNIDPKEIFMSENDIEKKKKVNKWKKIKRKKLQKKNEE